MTDRAEMEALATRCEKATGPDRRLDEKLAHVLTPQWDLWRAPQFTASIDAAMTLLDGVCVLITLSEIKGDGMPMCIVGNPADASLYEGVAATMPLALCAAALRAHLETRND